MQSLRQIVRGAAEPDELVRTVRQRGVAQGDPDIGGFAEPGTAAQDAVFAGFGTAGIHLRALVIIFARVPVRRPFPHIPQRVVNAESVRVEFHYRMSMRLAIALEPGNLLQWPIAERSRTSTRGEFPFRFGR